MKAFTSLEQSKKLAKILPLESADMHLTNSSIKGEMYVGEFKPVLVPYLRAKDSLDAYSKIVNNMITWEVIPCWSLAALLDVLPSVIKRNGKRMFLTLQKAGAYNLYYKSPDRLDELWVTDEEPVDACVAMIEMLYEFIRL